MNYIFAYILFLISCSTEPEPINDIINSYQLSDLNVNSRSYGEILSHNQYFGKVVLYYFPVNDT